MWPILLLFPFGASSLQSGKCDYSLNDWYDGETSCINPENTASVEFTWSPLFSKGAKFIYAVDGLDGEDIADLDPLKDPTKVKDWKGTMVGWWLEYDSASLNNSDYLMLTEMDVFFTNTTNKIEGDNNGCEGLLGAKCIEGINSTLRELWADDKHYGAPLLTLYTEAKSLLKSCPEDLFASWEKLQPRINTLNQNTDFNTMLLASEAPPKVSPWDQHIEDAILPSGNKSFTYSRTTYDKRELKDQERKAAVAIFMRYPERDSETNDAAGNTTKNDISVEFVCAKLKESSSDDSSSDDSSSNNSSDSSSDDEDAAGITRVPTGILSGMLISIMLWWMI